MLEVVRRLAVFTCLAAASSAFAQDEVDWQTIESVSLGAGERKILSVRQQGFDLAVRAVNNGEIISVQDGPDMAFGTELIALENSGQDAISYQIQIAPVLKSAVINYRFEELAINNPEDWLVALALHNAGRVWYRSDSTADEVLGLLEPLITVPASEQLQSLLWLLLADTLERSGQSERAISLLNPYMADLSRSTPRSAYLHWLYAIILNQGLYVPEALEQVELLVTSLDDIPAAAFENETERRWLEAQIRNSLGVIRVAAARRRGDDELLQSAGDLFRANLQAVQNHPDISLLARLTEYLGGFYSFTEGRSNLLSSQLLQEAESLYIEAGDQAPLSVIRNNQAYAALGRGEINEALQLYLQALELNRHSRNQEGNAYIRARLGYLYFILGDYRRAQVRYEESIGLYQRLGLLRRIVHNQLELAEVLRATDDNGAALELLLHIQANMASDAPLEERLRLASQLAHVLLDNGDTVAAADVIADINDEFSLETDSGRERLEFASRLFYVLEYDILRARLLLADGATEQASGVVKTALGQLDDGRAEPLQQLELLHLRMLIAKAERDASALLASGREGLALVNAVRNDVDYQFQGARWTSRTAHIQHLMVSTYLQRYSGTGDYASLDAAIELGQQFRALSLRQSRLSSRRDGETPGLRDARERVAGLRQELVAALLADASTAELERELARSEEDYQRQRMAVFAGNPQLISLSRSGIQQRLDDDEVALIFNPGDDQSHLVVLEQQSAAVYDLPASDELADSINAALSELATPGSELEAVRTLANLLLPAEIAVSEKNLLIEAEGLLTRLPFNVLAFYRDKGDQGATVAMVPSLSEFFAEDRSRAESQQDRLRVAIVADPIVNLLPQDNSVRQWDEPEFPRLPYTQVEAQTIMDTFGDNQTQAFMGAEANIVNLQRESSRQARILHIASHGFASEEDPLVLGLALANQPGSPVSSGLLTVEQIASTAFANELVVISACETGVGQALNGEPLMSLGRMFLANGAKAALTTLWPISDRANAEFMSSFYEALGELRLPPAQALGYAQAQLMQMPRYRHPFYWGAFQFQAIKQDAQPVYF